MNAWKTVLFTFCTIIGLLLICIFFPADGIKVGNVTLRFPSIDEALTPVASFQGPSLSAEERKQLEALTTAKRAEFDEFCASNPARFYMPQNDTTYLDTFFEALDSANINPVRIIHYGDSQLEGDRITSSLREHFQKKFGGCGVGMIKPVFSDFSYTNDIKTTPTLRTYNFFGLGGDHKAAHRRYGPQSQFARLDGNTTFTIKTHGADKFPSCQKFSKVSVAMAGSGSFTLEANGQTYQLTPTTHVADTTMCFYTATIKGTATEATLTATGHMDIYGILLDGTTGVSMDNVAMRGCAGKMFTQIARSSIEPYYKQQNVGLIILEYGSNVMADLGEDYKLANYKRAIKEQIAFFHQLAPKAKILFLGPADMATSVKGVKQTYPWMEQAVQALREAANESGAAFWDMYRSMGGHNSILEWVNATPALAARDYVHFSPLGSEKISKILYDTFQLYYKFYRFRTGKDPIELPKQETTEAKPAKK